MTRRQKWIAALVILGVGWFVCGYVRARAAYDIEAARALQQGVRHGPQGK